MPDIVNKVQQVLHTGIYPMSMYSRVISIQVALPPNDIGYNYTERFGDKTWLLGVKVWPQQKAVDTGANKTAFTVHVGGAKPVSAADVYLWEQVLPITHPLHVPGVWLINDGMLPMQWEMSRLYKRPMARFAVRGQRVGPDNDILQVSFLISEG